MHLAANGKQHQNTFPLPAVLQATPTDESGRDKKNYNYPANQNNICKYFDSVVYISKIFCFRFDKTPSRGLNSKIHKKGKDCYA
jgi:hypothetical protein